jgi:hypothetical protein
MRNLFIILLVGIVISANSQDSISSFSFPIRPGTKEWESLTSPKQKLEALQIPNDLTVKMSTIRLLESCINYPITWFLFSNQTTDIGFKRWRDEFKALNIFYQREDRVDAALNLYSNYKINSYSNYIKEIDQIGSVFSHVILDIIISQNEILGNLNSEQANQLLNIAIKNYNDENVDSKYTNMNLGSTGRLVVLLLKKSNYEDSLLSDPSILILEKSGILTKKEILETIIKNKK